MALFARRSYRAPIAAAVLILLAIVASRGRAAGPEGFTAGPEGPAYMDARRRPVGDAAARVPIRAELAPPAQPVPELLLTRNPFAFAPRGAAPAPLPSPVMIVPPPAVTPVMPPSVPLSLIGIATNARADGRVDRTAIITGPAGAFFMVREADAVTTRYRVDAVLADGVVLADEATGGSLRLILR